ncbi:MAG: DUF1275 domain-containing protein [Clostridium sp.]|nr:DUF1275 domain-containing protein [Clostridium sp.]
MQRAIERTESLRLGIMLSLIGGFMDAYSYMCRGEVFANAQTGNMLLLGINLCEGNFKNFLHYLFPVISFGIGILISEILRFTLEKRGSIHWRQVCIAVEAVVLICVSFMPQSINLIANSLTSLACGIQVQGFRKIRGNGIATTMCIGNFRSANENMLKYFEEKNRENGEKSLLYYFIILCFIIGAVIGNIFVKMFRERAIVFDALFLLITLIVLSIDLKKSRKIEC